MENIFKKLGGLRLIRNEKDTNLSLELIKTIESFFVKDLPQDYLDYIKKYGLRGFNEMVLFKPLNINPLYKHPNEVNFVNPTFEGSYIDSFFGKLKDSSKDIFYNIKTYKDRVPSNFLPIGNDGFGNLLLMNLNNENYESIYFWDHENEWDVEEYEKETGLKFTEDIKFQNLYLLGTSFSDFLNLLEVKEEV